jgi:2-oxoacid:acceptor oxidoreductase delta subunit (pyruvate/2-ketoisovalerate family)
MTKPCEITRNPKPGRKNIQTRRKKKVLSFEPGLQKEQAIKAAQNCLSLRDCLSCDLCGLLCPELCIIRNDHTDQVEIDLDYCKGCGICSSVCPRGAIRMVLEEGI